MKALANEDICLYTEQKSQIAQQPYIIKNFLTYFCLSGEVQLRINGELKHIKAPSFVTYFPEYVITEEKISKDFSCAIIVIDKPLLLAIPSAELPDILFYLATHPVIKFPNAKAEQLQHAFQTIYTIADTESPYRRQCLAHLLAMAIYHPASPIHSIAKSNHIEELAPNTENDGRRVNRAMELIHQHCTTERFVSFYADRLGISSVQLNNDFKKYLNCSVTEYIHRLIIRKAEILLISTRSNIAEISFELNFKAPEHFIMFFKKHKGITPERFRQENTYWIKPNITTK